MIIEAAPQAKRRRHPKMPLIAGAAIALLSSGAARSATRPAQSGALWRVVHDLCVVDKQTLGFSKPCTSVDLAKGIAIVKDEGGPTGYLLVPTRRLTGIKDPALLKPGMPNYWQAAWDARRFVERKARRKLDRADAAIAVNSVAGRTQNQLHFHVDCVNAEVKETLALAEPMIGTDWGYLSLLGHPYWVRTLKGSDLGIQDSFRLLAESDPSIASVMGKQTLIVVGAQLQEGPGFFVIRGSAGPTDRGHGEELVDRQCAVLRR